MITFTWNAGVQEEMAEAAMRRLTDIGDNILTAACAIAPMDTGALVGSGEVLREDREVVISFDTDYAVIQHERADLRHAPGRRAGFLREAVDAAAKEAF